jgi:hypothetical protein
LHDPRRGARRRSFDRYPLVVKPASTVLAAGGSPRQRSARLAPDEQALAALVSDCGSQCLVQERREGQVLSLGARSRSTE